MKKEILKDNVVDALTLFVGVGGTGSKIVTRVAELCSPGEVENINFVCLDTNVNDLTHVDRSSAHIYSVQTSTNQTVGDYLDYDLDALSNWFPKNAVMYDKTVSEGAGQVRAISRLALNATIKTGAIAPLYDAIDDLFRKDGRKLKQAVRVVIVSTASGGTGSGIILPLSMFIRDYIKNKYPQGAIVRAMILLPETLDGVIKSAVERDSQRRNAYATIKEINAFMMKGSGFCDIDGDFKRYQDLHIDVPIAGTNDHKSLSLLPCDFCFLLDGQNAEDQTLVTLDQYIEQAAQALYEQNIGPMQEKAFSVEDNIIKEMSNPGNLGRNRFGGIGAGILRYPYEDIARFISYSWAMESIGGSGQAAKWSKYDNEFAIKKAEAKKKGLSASEGPKLEEVYNAALLSATDTFSRELRLRYDLPNASARFDSYHAALLEYMHTSVQQNAVIQGSMLDASALEAPQDYANNASLVGHAPENLDKLRNFHASVTMCARKTAESTAEAIFMSDTKPINARDPYTLEFLLRGDDGEVLHPNAARFMLYLVKSTFEEQVKYVAEQLRGKEQSMVEYQPRANLATRFDDPKSRKEQESDIDAYAAAESKLHKNKYNEAYHTKLNTLFVAYYQDILEYCNLIAELEAYKQGLDYVKELCKGFERFFATFPEKVESLQIKQDDIIESLRFIKGDSVLNVCASKEMLEELARSTRNQSAQGAMLSSELNSKIIEAVKANVKFEREIRNADIVEDDRRIDIFDNIMLGFFLDSVMTNCDTIDLNIIEAIAMEKRLLARIKQREQQTEAEASEPIFDKVTPEEIETYIRQMVSKGLRLSAPGIQTIPNEEPRRIQCVAYNESLKAMRNYRVDSLLSELSNKSAVPSVSRYELRFFNALYNITPDKLKKFACARTSETGVRSAGLYHTAYESYARNIGPDSTKDTMISTHIDKRWDSLAVLPELDFDFQAKQMLKIHKAMIYGLLHKAITFRRLSVTSGKKRVYRYENSDERYTDLIVSNGTLCDEVFEILDALYISSAVVEDIDVIRANKRRKDAVRNSNYTDTVFYQDLQNFHMSVENYHSDVASLFEIPMTYYNTLPNNRRYDDEIAALVDAVVETLRTEIYSWEKPGDARFILCSELVEQFNRFVANYEKTPLLHANLPLADNPVVDIIYRKVKNELCKDPEPDGLEDLLDAMKASVSSTKVPGSAS